MPGFDHQTVAQEALRLAEARFRADLMALAKAQPGVVRRGARALLEPKLTGRAGTALRRGLNDLASRDESAYYEAISELVGRTSLQETVKLLGAARPERAPYVH